MSAVEPAVDVDLRAAILAPAVDYIESWLDGDSDRMGRCLHPDLVKRDMKYDEAGGPPRLRNLTRADMVTDTALGEGRGLPRPYDASVLDVHGDIATVRLLSSASLDYLHVARFDDRWLIVNVLWQPQPKRQAGYTVPTS